MFSSDPTWGRLPEGSQDDTLLTWVKKHLRRLERPPKLIRQQVIQYASFKSVHHTLEILWNNALQCGMELASHWGVSSISEWSIEWPNLPWVMYACFHGNYWIFCPLDISDLISPVNQLLLAVKMNTCFLKLQKHKKWWWNDTVFHWHVKRVWAHKERN